MRPAARPILVVALLASVGACNVSDLWAPKSPPLPAGAVRVDTLPNAAVRGWWREIEACSGRSRSIEEIDWYLMPGRIDFFYDDQVVFGLYVPHHAIVLADLVADLPPHARHEILHAVRRDDGDPDVAHASADFTIHCSHLVTVP